MASGTRSDSTWIKLNIQKQMSKAAAQEV